MPAEMQVSGEPSHSRPIEQGDLLGSHVEIDLSGQLVKTLNADLKRWGETPGELFRKALALYRLASMAKAEGNSLAIVDSDGEVVCDIEGF